MLLQIPLDRRSPMPLYEQLYRHIRRLAESGALVSGEKLPSKRSLAALCAVSLVTVETAYAQLAAEGFLETRPRSGVYVAEIAEAYPPEAAAVQNLPPAVAQTSADTPRYDCRFGRVDASLFPVNTWRAMLRDALRDTDILQTGEATGELPLRREIAAYLNRLRGLRCAPEQIVVGAGLEWLLLTLLPLFPTDAVYGLEEPGYDVYRRLLSRFGRRTVFLPVGQSGPSLRALEQLMPDILYLSPSHQFPLGGVMSYARRRAVLSWAEAREDRYILEDDYDSEFRYRGLPIPSLQSMDHCGRVIYLGSFSKSLAPGLRIGYMALPDALARRWQDERAFSCAVSRPDQLALARLMREGHFERHIARARTVYRRRRELLFSLLAPYAPQLKAEDDGAGVFVRLLVDCGLDEESLLKRAGTAGIRLSGASRFYAKETPPAPSVLLGVGGVADAELPHIADALARVWGLTRNA